MPDPLRLQDACTNAERQEAESLCLRKQLGGGSKWLTWLVLATMLVGMCLLLYFRLREDVPEKYLPYVFIAVFVFSIAFVVWKRRTRSGVPATSIVEVSEAGITILAADERIATPWSGFSECLESATLFLLMDRPKGVLLMVPKRVFPSESWQNWFRVLANDRPAPATPSLVNASPAPQAGAADQITLSFQLGFKDYLDRTLASWSTWGMIIVLAGMFVGISIYSAANPSPRAIHSGTFVFFVFVLPFLPVMSVMVILFTALNGRWSHAKYLVPQQVTLSDESIHIANCDGTTVLPWKTYTYYKETRWSFILWNPQGAAWFLLPKRAIVSTAEQENCRVLLARNLSRSRKFFG